MRKAQWIGEGCFHACLQREVGYWQCILPWPNRRPIIWLNHKQREFCTHGHSGWFLHVLGDGIWAKATIIFTFHLSKCSEICSKTVNRERYFRSLVYGYFNKFRLYLRLNFVSMQQNKDAHASGAKHREIMYVSKALAFEQFFQK